MCDVGLFKCLYYSLLGLGFRVWGFAAGFGFLRGCGVELFLGVGEEGRAIVAHSLHQGLRGLKISSIKLNPN